MPPFLPARAVIVIGLLQLLFPVCGLQAQPSTPTAPYVADDRGPCVGDWVVLGWDPVPGAQYYVVLVDSLAASEQLDSLFFAVAREDSALAVSIQAVNTEGLSSPGPVLVVSGGVGDPQAPATGQINPNPFPPGTNTLSVSTNPSGGADGYRVFFNGIPSTVSAIPAAEIPAREGVVRVAALGPCGMVLGEPVVVSARTCLDHGHPTGLDPLLGSSDTPGEAFALTVWGQHVFIADGSQGLGIIDLAEPSMPLDLGNTPVPDLATGVAAWDDHVAVAASDSGLVLYEVSDAASPRRLGTADTGGTAFAVAMVDTLAFVADVEGGLAIINCADPVQPVILGTVATPGDVWGLAVSGPCAYLAAGYSGLQIVDITDPGLPVIIGSHDTPGDASGIQLLGNLLYLADGVDVLVFDITAGDNPLLLQTLATGNQSYALLIHGDYLHVADRNGYTRILDLSTDPVNPPLVGDLATPGQPFGLAANSEVLLVADFTEGLQVCYLQCPAQDAFLECLPRSVRARTCHETAGFDFLYRAGSPAQPWFEYVVRVVGDSLARFSPADFQVDTIPAGAEVEIEILENGPSDCTIAYKLPAPGDPGIGQDALLFTLAVHGVADGEGNIQVAEAQFLDEDEQVLTVGLPSPAGMSFDCTPPDTVTSAASSLSGDQITLTWIDPLEPDVGEIHVLRARNHDAALASAYPTYGLESGQRLPAAHGSYGGYRSDPAWTLLATLPTGTGAYQYVAPDRGIYFHQIVARDTTGHFGPPLAGTPTVLSYVLGDIMAPADGLVTVGDLSLLGDTYRVGAGHPLFNPEADIGPTTTGNTLGLPLPDGRVQFEDLMIFSMGFGAGAKGRNQLASPQGAAQALVSWSSPDGTTWSCTLQEPCPRLKGLTVKFPREDSQEMGPARVLRGELLARQADMVVLQLSPPPQPGLDLAVLGEAAGVVGKGELFRIELDNPREDFPLVLEGRDLQNRHLEVRLGFAGEPGLPRVHSLARNFPNPFNPETIIPFALPREEPVKLRIYAVDGHLVRTLVSGRRAAGFQSVTWDGRNDRGQDVPSGMYFYRLEVGAFVDTRKMVLLR